MDMGRSAVGDEYRRFLSDHPGHPLGPGMPLGSPLRRDFVNWSSGAFRGETHLMAWERIIRDDPCSYCGAPAAGTVDHIEPKRKPVRGLGGAFSWMNLTGACESCNGSKSDKPLLQFLTVRARSLPRPRESVLKAA